MKRILVLRFSAMGDVVLLLPVVRALIESHRNVEVTIVTRPRFAPFFQDIDRVVVFPADVDKTYRGIGGLPALYRDLVRGTRYDAVIDLHDHLRTRILRSLFRLSGYRVVVFDKGRKEKKAATRPVNKRIAPLPHTVERYREAFQRAGFVFAVSPGIHLGANPSSENRVSEWIRENGLGKTERWIGLAPFAAHLTKVWPPDQYGDLIELLSQQMSTRFFLFGGGKQEIAFFEALAAKFRDSCTIVAGNLNLPEEIALMKQLDLMLCVDSSNMHLAALAGVPLLSIWGGTHPDVGFAPFGNQQNAIVQIDRHELPCRPCSVYGREDCYVGGFPCLTRITPRIVADRILKKLNEHA